MIYCIFEYMHDCNIICLKICNYYFMIMVLYIIGIMHIQY